MGASHLPFIPMPKWVFVYFLTPPPLECQLCEGQSSFVDNCLPSI